MSQEIIDFLTRYWVWIVLAVITLLIVISLKNKLIREKLNSLFGWPPEP